MPSTHLAGADLALGGAHVHARRRGRRGAVAGGALVDPHARRRGTACRSPQASRAGSTSAVPSRLPQPGEVRRGVDLRAHLRRASSSATSWPAARSRPPGRRARRPRAGAVATLSSPVSSHVAVDAVPPHGVGDAAQVRRAEPVQLGELVGPALDAVAEAVGQAGRREPAVAAAGLVTAVAGLEQHHVGDGVALLGAQRRPQPGVAAADHDAGRPTPGRAAAASGSGRAGSSSQ